MSQQLSTWSLLTATAGLLAFLIGVYTLACRDRKSPYLINSVFAVFLICLMGAAIDIAAELVAPASASAKHWLLLAGAGALLIAILVSIWRLWTMYVRFAYFVDPGGAARLKLLPVVRQYRAWRRRKSGPSYEHHPVPLGQSLKNTIKNVIEEAVNDRPPVNNSTMNKSIGEIKAEIRDDQDPRSLAMALRHQGQANELLGKLCIAFLKERDHYIQYMTASRHPIEFLEHLKSAIGSAKLEWAEVRGRIVAVDAYTSHFGFLDTINGEKSNQVRNDLGERLLFSNETYAGLHSASSAAFKSMKRASAQESMRHPTLVIYEDMYALSDLESVEQYRIFARHVIPSERLWDGMFTVFAETAQKEEDWRLISSYAGMTVDLRDKIGSSSSKVERKS